MEVRGKILTKKSDNKALKLSDDNWYNLNAPAIPYLEKMSKGDEVIITFEKKGVSRYVSKIVSATEAPKEEKTETTSSTGFACEVCGKELKDDKFKVCYMCNKKGLKKKTDAPASVEKKNYESKTAYGSPEDIAGKEVGCSLGAAATAASGTAFNDPETCTQFVLEVAERLLDWMRAKK